MTMTTGLDSGGTSWTETRLFDRTFAAVSNSPKALRVRSMAIAAGALVIVAAMLLTVSLR